MAISSTYCRNIEFHSVMKIFISLQKKKCQWWRANHLTILIRLWLQRNRWKKKYINPFSDLHQAYHMLKMGHKCLELYQQRKMNSLNHIIDHELSNHRVGTGIHSQLWHSKNHLISFKTVIIRYKIMYKNDFHLLKIWMIWIKKKVIPFKIYIILEPIVKEDIKLSKNKLIKRKLNKLKNCMKIGKTI